MTFFDVVIIVVAITIILFGFTLFNQYLANKANFDCSKCKVYDCPAHYCNSKKR